MPAQFVAPFIIPVGQQRTVKLTFHTNRFSASGAAGTGLLAIVYIGNSVSSPTATVADAHPLLPVASDGGYIEMSGLVQLPAGTYFATVAVQQNAAGTLTIGVTGGATAWTTLRVELV
jgi:hypothetical protein